jgi:hypothetical protein
MHEGNFTVIFLREPAPISPCQDIPSKKSPALLPLSLNQPDQRYWLNISLKQNEIIAALFTIAK